MGAPGGVKYSNAQGDHYMQVLADGGGASLGVNSNTFLDFDIGIPVAGTYQLAVRWDGHDGGSDSMYAQILELKDGTGGDIADWYRYSHGGDLNFATESWQDVAGFERSDAGGNNTDALWYLEPGDYTLRFTPREDGVAIDAFRLTLNEYYIPEPATLSLLAAGGIGLVLRRRRKH